MIPLPHTSGRRYAVLGLGKAGLAAARALVASGAEVLAWDDAETARHGAEAEGLTLAGLDADTLTGCEALIISPGIPHPYPRSHPAAAAAHKANVPILSEIALMRQACPHQRLVAITGTNGKSTTTALIGHILKEAGHDVRVGGNLGTPTLAFEAPGGATILVIEMSSYQLERTPDLNPDVAILLNITPDHLDRHGGWEGYVTAKRRVFDGARHAVIGLDDTTGAETVRWLAGRHGLSVTTLGMEAGDIVFGDGSLRDGTHRIDLGAAPSLPGVHNHQNAAAALAATRALGIDEASFARAIASFPGLAHRQERIGTAQGVTFINDSKATNAEAAARALACYDPIYWILGGQAKEGGLAGLEPLMDRIAHAFTLGACEALFAEWLAPHAPVTRCGTLDRAVPEAFARARAEGREGATVLLSPAAASCDQFAHFEQRGDVFRALAGQIIREAA